MISGAFRFLILLAASLLAAEAQSFVQTAGAQLTLDGQPFFATGSNNYALMYLPQSQVDAIFDMAAKNGFRVLRSWAFIDIGYADGSQSIASKPAGVYFHYWTGSQPAFNDDQNGLAHLDYVVYKAGQSGVRLILPFTNNWADFGGMDQYVRWRGKSRHDDFYTDLTIRGWYQDYIAHLLNRVNPLTGLAYKDDPAILGWELANEPRCLGSGVYPPSSSCTTATLTNWAADMASFIKSIDPNHLVSAGDEGFYCLGPGSDWTLNCTQGVDTVALSQAAGIDWMSFHLYPADWGKSVDWGTQWTASHLKAAAASGRPALLGEFGHQAGATRLPAYKLWTDAVAGNQGAGALFWWLTRQGNYDSFDVSCPGAVCLLETQLAAELSAGVALDAAPIADDHQFTTNSNTRAQLQPLSNVVTFNTATLDPATIDLDPATDGQQLTYVSNGGRFDAQPDGTIVFTPAPDFAGKTAVNYTITDSNGRVSNPAQILVNVAPAPGAALTLFSFETGLEGWGPGFWQADIGSVATSPDWSADGNQSLRVTATADGWFGVILSPAQNWTGHTNLIYTLKTLSQPTSTAAVIKVGANYLWCQGSFLSVPANQVTQVTADLTNLNCGGASSMAPDLSKVQELYLWFNGGGNYYVDAIQIR